MNSHSESEGEIVESETEKATTALPPTQTTSVNRRLRDALSPSPEASPRSPSPSGSRRSRNRSRSPYRAPRSPRGEKRRRSDETSRDTRQDNRRFKVHYEERTGLPGDRRRNQYEDSNRGNSHDNPIHLADDRDRNGNRIHRTRSRSPGRPDRLDGRYFNRAKEFTGGVMAERDRNGYNRHNGNYTQRDRDQQSVSDRGNIPSSAHFTSREAEKRSKSSQYNTGHINGSGSAANSTDEGVLGTNAGSAGQNSQSTEALSIEERRKRREAIKAKYKTSTTPLLVQALQQSSAPGSPGSPTSTPDGRSSRSVSPIFGASDANQIPSPAASPPPVVVADDAELANQPIAISEPTTADEPSAADYDPTMDMQEDRARFAQIGHEKPISASGHGEVRVEQDERTSLLPSRAPHDDNELAASEKTATKDDMFASDDDDDMFAAPKPATDGEPILAVNVPKAKELDMSLLDNWDDHEGYYKIILGELIEGRYHIQANLGKGMFSGVVRALDTKTDELVAIKIIRNNETMIKAGQKEMDILQTLAEADPEDKKHLIRLIRSFTHKGHLCMVFENLSINLREVLKKFGRDVGINLKAVRSYAQQMFLGLGLMRKCNILHADLKPDNILVNDARNLLKICDLGSAANASENEITPYLVSRFYRAPEIVLGIPYDFAIDMWSIGCTLFEMYTGKILFTGRSNNQMLRSIMECRGKFSLKMLKKAEFGAVHFDDQNLNFRSMERDKITGRDVVKLINFQKPTRDLKSRLLAVAAAGAGKKPLPDAELKEINLLADLLDRCLALNPEKRITPSEALKHPFIHRNIVSLSSGKV